MNISRRWWSDDLITRAISILNQNNKLEDALTIISSEFNRDVTYDSLQGAFRRNHLKSPYCYLKYNMLDNSKLEINIENSNEVEKNVPTFPRKEKILENEREIKRFAIIADLHCGHEEGLTPPKWQSNSNQENFWKWWVKETSNLGLVDLLIVNGDAIDGQGKKSRGVEQITTNRQVQVNMALKSISKIESKEIVCIAGTPYHTGKGEDWESVLAEKLNDTVCPTSFCDEYNAVLNGKKFHVKHKISKSDIPHGRATAILREQMWKSLEENVDVVIRSHVHYYQNIKNDFGHAIITPCLQLNSRFGRKECSGSISVGFVYAEILKDKIYFDDSRYYGG